jgi:hypothetical protein
MMGGMPFKFFWGIPLGFFVMFLGLLLFVGRKLIKQGVLKSLLETSGTQNQSTLTASTETSPTQVPEELQQAGKQVIDNLDWDIQLLEKELTTATDTKKSREIEAELQQKRNEYQTTVDRLGL